MLFQHTKSRQKHTIDPTLKRRQNNRKTHPQNCTIHHRPIRRHHSKQSSRSDKAPTRQTMRLCRAAGECTHLHYHNKVLHYHFNGAQFDGGGKVAAVRLVRGNFNPRRCTFRWRLVEAVGSYYYAFSVLLSRMRIWGRWWWGCEFSGRHVQVEGLWEYEFSRKVFMGVVS